VILGWPLSILASERGEEPQAKKEALFRTCCGLAAGVQDVLATRKHRAKPKIELRRLSYEKFPELCGNALVGPAGGGAETG
jgi:hypothetical protein